MALPIQPQRATALLNALTFADEATAIYSSEDIIIEYANAAMLTFWGKDDTIIGQPLEVGVPELKDQPFKAMLQQVLRTGKTDEGIIATETRIDNILQTRHYAYKFRAVLGEDGKPELILHTATDVTERLQGEAALREAQEQSEALNQEQQLNEELASVNEELTATNEELRQTQEQLAILNTDLEQKVQLRTYDLAQSEITLQAVNEELSAINEELTATNEELFASQSQLQQLVTDLAASENQVRQIVASAPFPIGVYVGREMRIQLVNQSIIDVWGKGNDVVGKTYHEVLPELEGSGIYEQLDNVFTTGEPFHARNQRVDLVVDDVLQPFYFNYSFTPLYDQSGEIYGVMNTAAEVTDVVTARMNSEENERRFQFLLNALPQQLWTASPDGILDYVNDVVISDFGHPAEIIIELGWQAFVHPDDLPAAVNKWQRAIKTKKEYLNQFRLKFSDGNYYWHLARAVPMVVDGHVTFWLGTNTNIHQQKTNEDKKDEFISIASHELKTPLTTIKAFFQLSKREADINSKLHPLIEKTDRQLDRLGRLIDDLLDVSKINAGKMVYNIEDFDFGQMLADTVESIQQTTKKQHIELHTTCDIMLRGDQHRLEQVLINLLNNAIKYGPDADKIIVHCTIESGNIIVSVQDFGIGIAEEHLKGLFDRFYRVDNSSARFQGLGLGLFISNEIVKRHAGSFWIESEPGKGSTFYFLLPLNGKQHFTDIATDNHTYYQGSFINIHYKAQGHYMDVEWIGYQNYESVVKGCEIMLNLMSKNNCSLVLNDNTLVKGNWSEAADWGAEVWFPAMAEAGLKKFAWIYSPSTFSRIAANKSLPSEYDAVQVAFFDSKDTALQWLTK